MGTISGLDRTGAVLVDQHAAHGGVLLKTIIPELFPAKPKLFETAILFEAVDEQSTKQLFEATTKLYKAAYYGVE